jgi:hypothetical protein
VDRLRVVTCEQLYRVQVARQFKQNEMRARPVAATAAGHIGAEVH